MAFSARSLLFIGLNYLPEPTGIAPYTAKMAGALSTAGRTVRSITGYPHYPSWKIDPAYTGLMREDQVLGVPVTRVRHSVPNHNGTVERSLMEILFGLHASVVPWGRPEVLVAVSPALFSTAIVQLRAQLQRVPHGIWIQDIYTRGLEETKGRSSTVTRIMRIVESQVLRRATGVAVIHERFRAYVIDELGVAPDRVTVIRNWTHLPEPSHFDRTKTREALGWADNEFVVLHAGNMGVKQGLEHVVETARNATDRSIRYVLMGNGSRRDALLRAADGLSNVQFIDSLDDEEYSAALRSADALLVNELPELREMSVPSKLTSYFSTGLPVIASTDPSSSTADEIRASGAGILVDPSDVRSIELAAQQLKNSPTDAASIGQRGPGYVSEVLAPETAYEKFGQWVDEMARRRSRS